MKLLAFTKLLINRSNSVIGQIGLQKSVWYILTRSGFRLGFLALVCLRHAVGAMAL